VKKATKELLEQIKQRPESYLVGRSRARYDLLIDLYQEVGYAPQSLELEDWRNHSVATWAQQDSLLPGNCTMGWDGSHVVSSWGNLPMSRDVLYAHSVCMTKSLAAAATLFAQSLYSLGYMERFQDVRYWAGSYDTRSRFTTLFQRPLSGPISDQLELEVLTVSSSAVPAPGVTHSASCEPVKAEHLNFIPPRSQRFFGLLCEPNGSMATIHRVTPLAVKDTSGNLKCLLLTQNVPAEFTAANVFSWTWVFPANGVVPDTQLVGAVRAVPGLGRSCLQIVYTLGDNITFNGLKDAVVPAFWAFTPRNQLRKLQASFEEAFGLVLDRYPDEEIRSLNIPNLNG
jgi:hypothetical protein